MTTNVVSAIAQKNRGYLDRAKPQRIGNERVAGLIYDGVNDIITVANFGLITNYTSIFSINCIFTYQSSGLTLLFSTANQPADTTGLYLFTLSNTVYLGLYNTGSRLIQFISPAVLTLGQTYCLSISFSDGNCRIYINGVNQAITVNSFGGYLPSDNSTSATIYSIGARSIGASVFSPLTIYDLKIFNKALMQYEIRELWYKQGDVASNFGRGSMLADWRFNNFGGLSNSVLQDSTQNRNNGTLVNYTVGDLTAGSACKIVDRFGNPIRN